MASQQSRLPTPSLQVLHNLLSSYMSDPDPSQCIVLGEKKMTPGKNGVQIKIPFYLRAKDGTCYSSSVSGEGAIIGRGTTKLNEKYPNPRFIKVRFNHIKLEDICLGDYKKKDTSTMTPEDAKKYEDGYNTTMNNFVTKTNMLVDILRMMNHVTSLAAKRYMATDPDVPNPKLWPNETVKIPTKVENNQQQYKVLDRPIYPVKVQVFHFNPSAPDVVQASAVYNRMLGFYWKAQNRFVHVLKREDPKDRKIKSAAYVEFKDGPKPVTCDTANLFITRNSIFRTYTIDFEPINLSGAGVSYPVKFNPFKENVIKTHVSILTSEHLTPEQQAAEQEADAEEELFDTQDAPVYDMSQLSIQGSQATEAKKGVDLSAIATFESQFTGAPQVQQLAPQPIAQLPPQPQQLAPQPIAQLPPQPQPQQLAPQPIAQLPPQPQPIPQQVQPQVPVQQLAPQPIPQQVQQYAQVPVQQYAPVPVPAPASAQAPTMQFNMPPQFQPIPSIPSISSVLPQ